MLIEIDKTIIEEAEKGNQLAFDVLNDLASSQRKGYHLIWAGIRLLDRILKLPIAKLGDNMNVFKGIRKTSTQRKSVLDEIDFRCLITLDSNINTHREGSLIIINPSDRMFARKQFAFINTTLLAENLNDCHIFDYISQWYLRSQGLEHIVSCNIDKQMGGGDPLEEVYKEYATSKFDRFCLCIADSDIKADVSALLRERLITPNHKPQPGKTYKKVLDFDNNSNPFNCSCYCFENVLEAENLIPFHLIAKDSNYKTKVTTLHKKTDLSFFDFKEGLVKEKLDTAKTYIQKYWKDYIFRNNSKILSKDVILKGFGSNLLSYILENKSKELAQIEDSQLTESQLKEYKAIGKRVCEWCCTMSVSRAMI